MIDEDSKKVVVASLHTNGKEIYRGRDIDFATQLAKEREDKYTLYTLTLKKDNSQIEIERCFEDGNIESYEFMNVDLGEIKHLKTLLSLLN